MPGDRGPPGYHGLPGKVGEKGDKVSNCRVNVYQFSIFLLQLQGAYGHPGLPGHIGMIGPRGLQGAPGLPGHRGRDGTPVGLTKHAFLGNCIAVNISEQSRLQLLLLLVIYKYCLCLCIYITSFDMAYIFLLFSSASFPGSPSAFI